MNDAPSWAKELLQQVQQISASQQALQQKFEQLQLSVQPPAPLPSLLTPESAAALQTHPYLPDGDRLYANLLQIAQPLVTVDEECAVLQRCYDPLVGRITIASQFLDGEPAAASGPVPSSSAPLPHVDNIYISKSGRRYDTTQPPPYPCRRCNGKHWSLTPCMPPAASHARTLFPTWGPRGPAAASGGYQ